MYSYFGVVFILLVCPHVRSIEISESLGDHVECTKSKIDHNVTLSSGHHAGSFLKANQSIKSMKKCVKQCCQMKGCDVAFFTNGACYSVKCNSIESCAPTANTNKRMKTSIAFVARPKQREGLDPVTGKDAELALTDNLIAEVTNESPFLNDEILSHVGPNQRLRKLKRFRRESWSEYRDIIIALTSGFAAVAVGVLGVITMTRKLVEEDDIYAAEDDIWNDDSASLSSTKNTSTVYGKCSVPKETTPDSKTNNDADEQKDVTLQTPSDNPPTLDDERGDTPKSDPS